MPDSPQVLDQNHLSRAAGGDESLMAELLDMMRRELPARRRSLDAALDGNDLEEAADIAHKLQGSAAYIGAFELESSALELENRLRNRRLDDLAAARAALEQAMEALERALASGVGVNR